MQTRTGSLLKNTMILSIGTICTKGAIFVILPFFTYWLTTAEYGNFDLISTYITLIIPVLTLDLSESVFRFLLDQREEKGRAEIVSSSTLIFTLGLAASILLCGVLYLLLPDYRSVLTASWTLYFMQSLNVFMSMYLRGVKKLFAYSLASILFTVGMISAVIWLVRFEGLGLIGILWGYALGYALSNLYILIRGNIYRHISFKAINLRTLKEMIVYSLPLIPNAVSWWVINAADRTIVTMVLGNSINGLLAIAHKIPALAQTLFGVFQLSWQQSASEAINDQDLSAYCNKVLNHMLPVLVSLVSGLLVLNYFLFRYVFDLKFFNAVYQAPILILSVVFSTMSQFIGGLYIAQKKSAKNGMTTVIAAAVDVVVNLALIWKIGIYAATISTLVAYASLFFIRYRDIRKTIKLRFSRQSMVSGLILVYFYAGTFYENTVYQAVNLLLAAGYFVFVNKSLLRNVLLKVARRKARARHG